MKKIKKSLKESDEKKVLILTNMSQETCDLFKARTLDAGFSDDEFLAQLIFLWEAKAGFLDDLVRARKGMAVLGKLYARIGKHY